jgi:uncharacterized protein YjiS (DUF1127 family)
MEMHSRQSLYEIHGISALRRREPRWRSLARLGIARILAVLKRIIRAIEAELAARHAIVELARMNDRMLRDLGITRDQIESLIRRPRRNVRGDDGPVLSSDTGPNVKMLLGRNTGSVVDSAIALPDQPIGLIRS